MVGVSPNQQTPAMLLANIRSLLGGGNSSNFKHHLGSQSLHGHLYEAYLFSLCVEEAKGLNYSVHFEDVAGMPVNKIRLRRGPGPIHQTQGGTNTYTHAVLVKPNQAELELHAGVQVRGNSGVLHEADLLIVDRRLGKLYRSPANPKAPAKSAVKFLVEAKYYTKSVNLGVGRGVLGLHTEIGSKPMNFVCTCASGSVRDLMKKYPSLRFVHSALPGHSGEVDFRSNVRYVL